jgi:hypothetical protein
MHIVGVQRSTFGVWRSAFRARARKPLFLFVGEHDAVRALPGCGAAAAYALIGIVIWLRQSAVISTSLVLCARTGINTSVRFCNATFACDLGVNSVITIMRIPSPSFGRLENLPTFPL